jgi:hypothetical protein
MLTYAAQVEYSLNVRTSSMGCDLLPNSGKTLGCDDESLT